MIRRPREGRPRERGFEKSANGATARERRTPRAAGNRPDVVTRATRGSSTIPFPWGARAEELLLPARKKDHDIKDREGCSGEREHGNNSVTCVRTGSDPPSRVGPGRMCDEPWQQDLACVHWCLVRGRVFFSVLGPVVPGNHLIREGDDGFINHTVAVERHSSCVVPCTNASP